MVFSNRRLLIRRFQRGSAKIGLIVRVTHTLSRPEARLSSMLELSNRTSDSNYDFQTFDF